MMTYRFLKQVGNSIYYSDKELIGTLKEFFSSLTANDFNSPYKLDRVVLKEDFDAQQDLITDKAHLIEYGEYFVKADGIRNQLWLVKHQDRKITKIKDIYLLIENTIDIFGEPIQGSWLIPNYDKMINILKKGQKNAE